MNSPTLPRRIACALLFLGLASHLAWSQLPQAQPALADGRSTAEEPQGHHGAAASAQYFHILSTGQSLALGFTAWPALSTTQPYANLSLSPNLGGYNRPLVPLVDTLQETPSSGMANTLHALDSMHRAVVVGLHASSGSPYVDLKQGTGPYFKAMAQVDSTRAELMYLNPANTYTPIAVTVIHGEADNDAGNAAFYQGYLEEWQRDYETDVSARIGTQVSLPMFVSQMNSGWTGELAVAQYNAHKANPGKIFLVGPKYHYDYFDDLHLGNVESKHLGEMFGKVIHEVVVQGNAWSPTMPTSVTRVDSVITLDYHIPVGRLVIDTVSIAKRPHYGFEFLQTGGDSVWISAVRLVSNGTQVQVVLSGIPNGTDERLRYAFTCYHGDTGFGLCGNGEDATAVGGNIRDQDSTVSPAIGSTGLPLYNWGVTFEEAVLPPAAVAQAGGQPHLRVFPLPTARMAHVAADAPVASLQLRDLAGRLLLSRDCAGDAGMLDLDLSGEVPGTYLLVARFADGRSVAHRVVVQH